MAWSDPATHQCPGAFESRTERMEELVLGGHGGTLLLCIKLWLAGGVLHYVLTVGICFALQVLTAGVVLYKFVHGIASFGRCVGIHI